MGQFTTALQFGTRIFPMPQAMKIPSAKAAVDKEWEQLEKISAWDLTKVRSKKEVIDEARTKGAKVPFASLVDICHMKNAELEAKHLNKQGSSCTPRWYCERRFRILCSIHRNDSSKSHGYYLQIARVRRTGRRSISLFQSESGRCSQIVEKKKTNRNVQTIGFVYHDTKGLNHGPVWKTQSERNLYGHPLARLCWERQFEKILLKHGWEKIPNWECLFVHREKGLFLSVCVDDLKLAGKKQNIDLMWKVLNKEVDFGEPTSFLNHEHLGCTQKQCEKSKDIVDNYRAMFESLISAGGTEKTSMLWEI